MASDFEEEPKISKITGLINNPSPRTKKTKKPIIIILSLALALFLLQYPVRYYLYRDVRFRTNGTTFQIYRLGKWHDFLIKGVNLGAAKPGYYPGEMGITKKEYARWFRKIAGMNANSIRVYTILSPAFYEALYEYNMFARKPLYLFHGVWNNEETIYYRQNAYDPDITGEFKTEIADLIDLLHGEKTIPPRFGHAFGKYNWDLSPYVAGYILGIEHDSGFIINTNRRNSQVTGFDGNYLFTGGASPYECWLAEIGDYAIRYESQKYNTQKPMSWTNWITTDPLWHLSDPNREMEDAISMDTEHILAKDSYEAGLFASYHVYPYYPEFMMYDPEYTSYIDAKGKPNPYEAYLRDLRGYHTVPLLVAEFGIPSSRGMTHENILTGYNQGFVTEEEAGEYVADMFDSIVASGCAGGIVFTWQDEWSKRSWNTMDYDLRDRRAYWSNAQVSEQAYGILGFDPGKGKSVCYVDGNISEWARVKPLTQMNSLGLSVLNDEKYLYFLIRDSAGDVEKNKYAIAVSGLRDQGNYSFPGEGLEFLHPTGQCVIINGKDSSAVYVDAYYDIFYRHYSLTDRLGIVSKNEAFERKNSGIFNPIFLVLRRSLYLPLEDLFLPPSTYETGRLLHGNANPRSAEYNSLADFYISEGSRSIEIRIPWQLLNVADPSTRTVIGDLYTHDFLDINPVQIEGFTFELFKINGPEISWGGSGFYSWKSWEEPGYHERLKRSYGIIKSNFAKY